MGLQQGKGEQLEAWWKQLILVLKMRLALNLRKLEERKVAAKVNQLLKKNQLNAHKRAQEGLEGRRAEERVRPSLRTQKVSRLSPGWPLPGGRGRGLLPPREEVSPLSPGWPLPGGGGKGLLPPWKILPVR